MPTTTPPPPARPDAGWHSVGDLHNESRWSRIEGHSYASRRYASRGEFVDQVLAPFGARFATGEPFRPVRIRSILADGDSVAVVWDGRGIANDGVPCENSYAWIMRVDGDKVIDGIAFNDSISFNALWDRVQP